MKRFFRIKIILTLVALSACSSRLQMQAFAQVNQPEQKLLADSSNGKGRSEERRVGKECRSLCDWSSDVCSSDLSCGFERLLKSPSNASLCPSQPAGAKAARGLIEWQRQIGRASCRERV